MSRDLFLVLVVVVGSLVGLAVDCDHPQHERQVRMALTLPWGNDKGKPLEEAGDGTLKWHLETIGANLAANKSKYPDHDRKLIAGIRAELDRRAKGGQQQASAPAQRPAVSIATTEQLSALAGSYTDPKQAMEVMRTAAQLAHLVTPQTSVPMLPLGCVIATSLVWVDPDRDTYGIPSKDSTTRGLDKTALARISAAAGVDWHPSMSRRLDNGKDPYYVRWRSVGYVRSFDGSQRTLVGNVEIDLRDGAPEALECEKLDREGKDSTKRDANGVPKELVVKRKFIVRLAESKARNRAIRDLGVRTSYERAELQEKPFTIARIMFTGHSDDPALKLAFAQMIGQSFMAGRAALFGPEPVEATARFVDEPHDPPPVGQSVGDPGADDDDTPPDYGPDPGDYDPTTGEIKDPKNQGGLF